MSTKDGLLKSIRGVIAQGQRSFSKELGMCAYRGDNGLKCAAGQLIEDNCYSERLEGMQVASCRFSTSISDTYKTEENWAWSLAHIQQAHDSADHPERFVAMFKRNIKEKVEGGFIPQYCLEAIEIQEQVA